MSQDALPLPAEIRCLPFWSRVTLAPRQVQHSWAAFRDYAFSSIDEPPDRRWGRDWALDRLDETISISASVVDGGKPLSVTGAYALGRNGLDVAQTIDDPLAGYFADAVARAAEALTGENDNAATVHHSLYSFVQAASEMRTADDAMAGIRIDLDLLSAISVPNAIHPGPAISPKAFAHYSQFDAREHVAGKTTLQIASWSNSELAQMIRNKPELLFGLTPRQFEELVAEIFHARGFEVSLAPESKDGGYDVLAVRHTIVPVRFLIECKRWRGNLGVKVVRGLHGVVQDARASNGLIVTTSGFTSMAQQYIDRHRWAVEGRSLHDVLKWLEEYEQIQQGRRLGITPMP